jgi:hypothetical protein
MVGLVDDEKGRNYVDAKCDVVIIPRPYIRQPYKN